jgi:hypothetical protein
MYTKASNKLQKSYCTKLHRITRRYEAILGRVINSSDVDEGRASDILGDGERDEAEHGEAAVPELGVGAHDTAAPRLGALPLEHRHQRRHRQHRRRGREPRQPGPAAGLRQEAAAAGRFDGERGYEADHGEPAVDALRSWATERQRVPDAGLRLGRRSGRGRRGRGRGGRFFRWLNIRLHRGAVIRGN